jgi:folate-dependent phosphoribosylglycinamide formyltransferase PurN
MTTKMVKSDKITRNEKILFLKSDKTPTKIIHTLNSDGYEVWYTDEKIEDTEDFDMAISFGYRHILRGDVLHNDKCPIINLHIGFLPYNRGVHPNFWSFYDGTPNGVTIHLIDEGIDTGDIIFQRYITFDRNEKTFAQTHSRLIAEIEELFIKNMQVIVSKSFTSFPQRGVGSYHKAADLPEEFAGWQSVIRDEIARLDKLVKDQTSEKNYIIDQIENARKSNNVNWMDLLRLVFLRSPNEAREIVKRINNDDKNISDLFKRLGE